jgi:hypothetical protein
MRRYLTVKVLGLLRQGAFEDFEDVHHPLAYSRLPVVDLPKPRKLGVLLPYDISRAVAEG